MVKNKSKYSWVIGTGSSILAVLGIRLIDNFVGTSFLTSIWQGILWILSIISRFFTQKFEMSLWFLILLPILVIGIILLILWIISKFPEENKESSAPQIQFLKYTQDIIEGILYRWEYVKNYSGKFEILNIAMYCPDCKCSIIYDKCPVCKKHYGRFRKDIVEIEALIRHRIENKNQYGY